MVDYNIEFAHIYLDEEISSEQTDSLPILKDLLNQFNKENKTYSIGIMIDDFSPIKTILDVEKYIDELRNEINYDYVAFESQLAMFTFKFISELAPEYVTIKKENNILVKTFHKADLNIGLISKDNKPTCALLLAIWYLSRLGVYGLPAKTRRFNEKEFVAKSIITILPKKYEKTEEKVFELIKNTMYSKYLKNIENIYF